MGDKLGERFPIARWPLVGERNGLVDEYHLWFFPVVLGTGKRLFADGAIPSGLELVEHEVSTTGVMIATYTPTASIGYGSFAFEVPTDAEVDRRRKLADA